MILGGSSIRAALEGGDIFRTGTWDVNAIKESSYNLRVASDGMMVDGKFYPPGEKFPDVTIEIKSGAIAILSTVERFCMPATLVGHQGIRFDYAVRGLTGLMGIQVDPLYGCEHEDERLYLRFINVGGQDIYIQPGEAVFNIEFQKVDGDLVRNPRRLMWDRIVDLVQRQPHSDWSYATRIKIDIESEMEKVRRGPEAVVMFGIFLVAATLLGVMVTLLLSFKDTPAASVPSWVTGWGWVMMLTFIGIAGLATAGIGIAVVYQFLRNTKIMS